MLNRRTVVVALMIVCLGGLAVAQDEELPLSNWGAPPYWTPAPVPQAERGVGGGMLIRAQGMTARAEALPSSPLPFVAIAPCRIVDTRQPISDGFHQPNFADDEARTFNLPASTDCPGLPATAGAYSLNIQFRPLTVLAYLTAYPTGTTRPGVSTLTAGPAAWVENAAVVPAGTSGAIDIYCQYAGRVVIDINGYYGPASVVTSLNTLTGDVTLAEGSNVTITPSGNTVTIAATGGPGGVLPTGITGQTLYHNGSAWTASSALTNDGTNVGISGNLLLPATTSGGAAGVVFLGGSSFLHNYGPAGAGNTFVGQQAGNFTMGGTGTQGKYNTGSGFYSLTSNTTGSENTASGSYSLYHNTTGYNNTATGYQSMFYNTTGSANTASGYGSLYHNTTGNYNTASGVGSLTFNTTGSENTANGLNSLYSNTTGSYNTASGLQSMVSNTTGSYNTASGLWSLYSNTTGGDNTASGYNAGYTNTTGFYNTFLGYLSDAAANNLTNATALGANAVVDASNHVRIGDTTVTQIGGQVAWSNLSDARLKENIRDLGLGLDFVMQLRPVSFTMKQGNGRTDMGFLAQDMEALLGDDYNVLGIGADKDRTLSLRGTDLIAPLVKAVQEQQATIQAQQARLDTQQAQIGSRDARIAALEARLTAIEARMAAK
jgi:hypothetical protein